MLSQSIINTSFTVKRPSQNQSPIKLDKPRINLQRQTSNQFKTKNANTGALHGTTCHRVNGIWTTVHRRNTYRSQSNAIVRLRATDTVQSSVDAVLAPIHICPSTLSPAALIRILSLVIWLLSFDSAALGYCKQHKLTSVNQSKTATTSRSMSDARTVTTKSMNYQTSLSVFFTEVPYQFGLQAQKRNNNRSSFSRARSASKHWK